jgi:hypothetical protein
MTKNNFDLISIVKIYIQNNFALIVHIYNYIILLHYILCTYISNYDLFSI